MSFGISGLLIVCLSVQVATTAAAATTHTMEGATLAQDIIPVSPVIECHPLKAFLPVYDGAGLLLQACLIARIPSLQPFAKLILWRTCSLCFLSGLGVP